MLLWFLLLFLIPAMTAAAAGTRKNCGGNFTARKGVLQTPDFPKNFSTPIDCEWVIKSEKENTSIIVYLTQMYVFEGLTFTEYVEYDKRLPGVVILSGEDVVKGKYVQCHKNVLVISLKLNSIENNHIRVMDNFMDVYGFNITYEITSGDVRKDHCNMMDCGYTGLCYDYGS
ncbi:basigin related [Holotrichia oblita]|uniref:Basigin related n=3 Tax=Holotrichia oblita TaxID=644536 RepID=A0ACB9T3D3_HOLOL|nr:basigin related [Holotrichia oblita]KAI4461318.1 basigin related [Holotrichia oblita]KAI4461320.1 basigin related [Holotrichia oblita]